MRSDSTGCIRRLKTMVNFESSDLLATDEICEPLVIRGIRCHGGFDADAASPETKSGRQP
jgi:hypothetical protein